VATSKPDTGILSWQRSISVFIPALNEEKNLEPTVARLIEALTVTVEDYEIIIVDDGSSDGTGAVADRLAAENSAIRALHNARNMGLGHCFTQGYREASKNFFVYIPVAARLSKWPWPRRKLKLQTTDPYYLNHAFPFQIACPRRGNSKRGSETQLTAIPQSRGTSATVRSV
jgi:cellulose synthase/poly-beta-1,6-N-acetylglucosamine synthase-like glycosyltransferase